MNDPTPYIIGEVLFDCFPNGHNILGGAPFNVAWHLAGFGSHPLFLSAIGSDQLGTEILERMGTGQLRQDGVQIIPNVATGRVDVDNADSSPEYRFPAISAWDRFDLAKVPLQPPPSLLYQGSLFLRSEQSRHASMQLAKRVNCRRFVDVNLRPPWFEPERIRKLVTGVHCLKVSEDELQQLANWFALPPSSDLRTLAHALLTNASIDHLFITRGAEGAVWISAQGEVFESPAAPVETFVDSVGAGDASAAVAIHGLLNNWPIPLLLKRSMQFAARICGMAGAIPRNASIYNEVSNIWNRNIQ